MAEPDIDWTFAEAPAVTEPVTAPEDAGAPTPPRRGLPPWLQRGMRREQAWRWLAVIAVLASAAAATAWVVARQGAQRVRAQVTAEVLYEDSHSRAGEVDLALSTWADPPLPLADPSEPITAWRQRRATEINARVGAPLPTDLLTPADADPQVTAVEALPDDPTIWTATVVRTYYDQAGRALTFALPQRYHNLGPGLWERLPPDADELAGTTVFEGFRLSVTLPVADLPWLRDSLPAADAALVQACADWGPEACGDAKLVLRFTGQPRQFFPVVNQPVGQAAGLGPYPAMFDLQRFPARGETVVVFLPSPHVAGLPQDDAGAALTRAITVYGLAALADAQAGPSNRIMDYFRDALVARAELRLGLSTPPTYTLRAQDYLPINDLWEAAVTGPAVGPLAALPLRLQALSFLDHALAGQPATADAELLRGLHRRPGVTAWLADVLGNEASALVVSDWEVQAAAAFDQGGDRSLAELEGLSYSCAGETTLVRDGTPRLVPEGDAPAGSGQSRQALSPDGRYLATLSGLSVGQTALFVLDLAIAGSRPVLVTQAPEVFLAGWSAGQALVYIERADVNEPAAYHLFSYDWATRRSRMLVRRAVVPPVTSQSVWLPDRRSLVINQIYPNTSALFAMALASAPTWVPVDADAGSEPERLAERGFPSVLAPDGRQVAYSVPELVDGSVAFTRIEVATRAERQVTLQLETLRALPGAPPDLQAVFPVGWSGDSEWLLVMARESAGPMRLYMLPADGSGAPVQLLRADEGASMSIGLDHSADGRYLTYHLRRFGRATVAVLNLIDLEQVARVGLRADVIQSLALDVVATAWSPAGHRLALAGSAGLRVVDLDTGLARWVFVGKCDSVQWYGPPG